MSHENDKLTLRRQEGQQKLNDLKEKIQCDINPRTVIAIENDYYVNDDIETNRLSLSIGADDEFSFKTAIVLDVDGAERMVAGIQEWLLNQKEAMLKELIGLDDEE